MGGRGIVVLLAFVLGLGAVLYFTDEKPRTEKVAQTPVLEGRTLTDSVRMRWQFRGRPPIEIGRAADGRFQMQEPLVDVASIAHMKQIVDAWDSAQMRATPLHDDDAGRQQAGLVEPELVFTAEFADKQELTIEVGAPGPLGTTRFLRSHGKIWEGGEALLESMRANPDDLRERAVFRNAFGQATEVRLEQLGASGKRETLHVKLEQDGWRLLAPSQGRADPVAAQRFVTAILGLRVDDFAAGVTRWPERPPRIEVMVKGAYGEENLKLWQETGELFGSLPGRNLTFTSSSVQYAQIFENAVDSMRARILVPMGEGTFAEMIDLLVDPGQGRGERVRLHRATPGEPWALVEPVAYAAAPTPAAEAVHAVQLLVAMEFVEDADQKRPRAEDPRYGLMAGRWALTVRGVRDQAPTTLWFGSEAQRGEDKFVHACRADEPDTVVLVQKAHVDTLKRLWLDYCALRIIQQPADVDRLDLAHKDGRVRSFVLEGGKWQLQGTPGERDLTELVTEDLRDLVGSKAVDARAATFEQPDWGLKLMRKNGDELALLKCWDRGDDTPLVVQAGERSPVAFELKPRLGKALRALWQ